MSDLDLDSELKNIIEEELNKMDENIKKIKSKSLKKVEPKKTNVIPKVKENKKEISPKVDKKKKYDYVIIGGGPTGLALGWYLGKINKKVIIVEKESELGGCHRVQRVEGLFTEHGPRVYSDAYINYIELLNEMGIKFDDLYTLYSFNLSNIGDKTILDIKFYEIFSFILAFIQLSINTEYGKNITMRRHMERFLFTVKTMDYIDRVCRLTDGATIDNYTLFQFLQLVNQQIFYKLYQPKLPNDRGLLKLWEEKLLQFKNIDIVLNQEVLEIKKTNNIITSIVCIDKISKNRYEIEGDNFILAIPPRPLINILNNSIHIQDAFGEIKDMVKWSKNNSYFDYIPVTMHFKDKINLPKRWGFPNSDWGLAYIVMTDYMKFNDPIEKENSKTVISTCITYPEEKSQRINKTAHECDIQEIYNEVLYQMRLAYPNLPLPDKMIISPQVYKDNDKKMWINNDTAYVLTNNKNTHIKFESDKYKNLYNCGTHNGKSNYYFTSMESAVSNAKYLANILEPSLNLKIKETRQLTTYIYFCLLFVISTMIVRKFGNIY